jgi:hypothetical protein
MPTRLSALVLAAGIGASVPAAAGTVGPAEATAEGVEWIVEDGSNLLLRLVMEEGRKPCGGVLTVDPTQRTVRFEGIPGDLGCKRVVEASFADVKALRTQRMEAGFVVELVGKGPKLVLLPLPHFAWFERQFKARSGGDQVDQALASVGGASGADGDAMNFGGVAGGGSGVTLQRVDLPQDVQADTQKAVDLIREAMGRQPAPASMLREVLQGRPEDATVSELLSEPGAFVSGPVRVRARLGRSASGEGLRLEEEGASLSLVPEPSAEARLGVALAWLGRDVEVVGRLRRAAEAAPGALGGEYYLQAWECIGPEAVLSLAGTAVTLPELLSRMGDLEGEVVRVVGRFRGRNLFGDLPARSQKGANDWVVKSERAAIWVTGHKPGGEGWSLDLDAATTSEWLELVGRPRVRHGVAYLQAIQVALVPPPRGARVVPPRRMLSSRPTEPPSVVFCLPLEGERIGPTTRVVVQFDRNMDEESFKDRVRLREESGSEIPVRLGYDESRRSLVISPLRPPAAGRGLQVQFLPGIVDVDGVALAPRPGRTAQGDVVEALRFGSEGD